MTDSEILLSGIGSLNPGIFSLEKGKAGIELSNIEIGLGELGQVLDELVFNRADGGDGTDSSGESERFHLKELVF